MSTQDSAEATQTQHRNVIVIGAGFAGIGAAIKLQQQGFDFLVLEKADEVGGVWRENTYPDCACDIPSALYSYSFYPNPKWSRFFAEQAEIKQYTLDTVNHFSLNERILYNRELHQARWSDSDKLWHLQTSGGKFSANFVIMASGPMHKPVFPRIPGLETFTGEQFHSAQWRSDIALAGKKVAVIGSGASAIQFLPAIQSTVESLSLFQRTPPWVLPKLDMPISETWQERFARWPVLQRLLRKALYFQYEFLSSGLKRKGFINRLQGAAIRNIKRSIKDSTLVEKLTPDFEIGCKRILQSNTWYRALAKDNVEILAGVTNINGNTITDSSGQSVQADIIIFATGFEVANPPIAEIIYGKSEESLAERWQGSPEVYLGTAVKDCPNCFLTFGPNLYTYTSAFVIIEAQLDYILDGLVTARSKGWQTVEIDGKKSDDYNEQLQTALQNTVWNQGGCTSYFIDKNGRNSTNWPWTTFKMRREMKRFRVRDYQVS
jgi:cation diffusion facilitator CzcD-associated flavoprotein CzcO